MILSCHRYRSIWFETTKGTSLDRSIIVYVHASRISKDILAQSVGSSSAACLQRRQT